MLIKVKNRYIKEILKATLGLKEEDFNDNLTVGSTIQPVCVVNNMNLKEVHLTEADFTNGTITSVVSGLHLIRCLWIKQVNTETDPKNFTFIANTLDGRLLSHQISIINDSWIFIVHPDTDAPDPVQDFGTGNNSSLIGIWEGLMLKDLRISQDSADGTAQNIVIKVVWHE